MTRAAHLAFALLPFSDVAPIDLDHLAQDLAAMNVATTRLAAVALPEHAFNARRRQYDARVFLAQIAAAVRKGRVLGVTAVDLFVPDLNFVLGLAESPGRAAVISLARLRHADAAVFRARAVKEAIHEIGHTMGLRHCADSRCVMHFSNTLADTDRKTAEFCGRCRRILESLR